MIYLIQSAGYKVGENNSISYFQLLKIGYTEDSNIDTRYSHYKLHNPTCQVLYEIPGGNTDIEQRIQYKFKDLLFEEYGKEWFHYSEDIIEFFKDIKSLEDIENNLPKGNSDDRKYSRYKRKVREILKYFSDVPCRSKEFNIFCEEIFGILGDKIKDNSYVMNYLESRFGEDKIDKYNKILEYKESGIYCEDPETNQQALEFMEEYNNLTEARKKLILLCESSLNGRLTKDVIEIVLAQIPDSDYIKSYYINLGPEKLKNLGYKRNNIEKALGIVTFSDELLYDSIYSDFKEGGKYLLSDIKSKLTSIYSYINYSATPKAKDLEKYFEVKESTMRTVINGEKKTVKYYELIKSKEKELRQELKYVN